MGLSGNNQAFLPNHGLTFCEKQARPNTWSHMLGMHMWQDPELARGGSPGNSKGRMICSISRVRSVQFCFPSNLCSLNTHRSRQSKLSSGKSQS